MAGSRLEPLHSPSELRREAQSLLNEAIRSEAPDMRKHLLAASYELIQRAEMISEPPRAPAVELPFPHAQPATYLARA
jgi:hypothetical protein